MEDVTGGLSFDNKAFPFFDSHFVYDVLIKSALNILVSRFFWTSILV